MFNPQAREDLVLIRDIALPNAVDENTSDLALGEVINVGQGTLDFYGVTQQNQPNSTAGYIDTGLSVGDEIAYPKTAGWKFTITQGASAGDYRVLRNEEVLMITGP